MLQNSEITFVEVVVADGEPTVEAETWWVTDTVYLRVPVDIDPELLATLVEGVRQTPSGALDPQR